MLTIQTSYISHVLLLKLNVFHVIGACKGTSLNCSREYLKQEKLSLKHRSKRTCEANPAGENSSFIFTHDV